jgi:leucyl aminopeptidase
MLERFQLGDPASPAVPIWPIRSADYDTWRTHQPPAWQSWLAIHDYRPEAGRYLVVPDAEGGAAGVALGLGERPDLWCYGALAAGLPREHYRIVGELSPTDATAAALGWGLGAYRFNRYRAATRELATFAPPEGADRTYVETMLAATYLVRDLINAPAEDIGPADLAAAARTVAAEFAAAVTVIEGEALIEQGYCLIHAVGRASPRPPCLIDLRWGAVDAPKVTLVGKGVCFDSGGLDLKTATGMRLMKKDMGGAATVLGLAQMVMAANLPVRLRVLLPAVDNAVSGGAFRPGDILRTRKGISVEIGNTDAEGRLVLADALAAADTERPHLLIDCATLTGSARIALGTDLPALFTDDEGLATDLARVARAEADPLWRLPLWRPYRALLNSPIADINNVGSGRYGGAITAALFLQDFVTDTPAWAHLDLYAWNDKAQPGRPAGGEAMCLRALYALLAERYAASLL